MFSVKGVNFYGPQSEYVISGSDCSNVFLWEKESEKIVQYFHADEGGVVGAEFDLRIDNRRQSAILLYSQALLSMISCIKYKFNFFCIFVCELYLFVSLYLSYIIITCKFQCF